MRKLFLLFLLLIVFTAFKSDMPAYRFFNEKGKPVR